MSERCDMISGQVASVLLFDRGMVQTPHEEALMRTVGSFLSLMMVIALIGCGAEINADDPNNNNNNNDTGSSNCPPPGKTKCVGYGPDKGMVCTCEGLFDCAADPNKCTGGRPVPPGGGGWNCSWTSEYKYTCEKKGSKDSPPGGNDWFCKWNDKEFKWECTRLTTPVPPGDGGWACKVDNETKKIDCTKTGAKTPPPGGGSWDCKTVSGEKVCTKKGDSGLPPGGSDWKCNKTTVNGIPTWVCWGKTTKGGKPPGGSGWQCKKVKTEGNSDIYKCEKPDTKNDYPPGGGWYSCVKGSEFDGTKCVKVPTEPKPPTPTPKPGQKCAPDTRMWCDGLQYCGWGQVKCLPSGEWETKIVNGKKVLNCQELSNGLRPNTVCACYHFFFNPTCCERPDCIVPKGSKGQICPKSGGKLCDYCNPQKPECVEAGAKCIVTNAHETFCGRLCSSNANCPTGYVCMNVKLKVGSTKQCIPADFSCYY